MTIQFVILFSILFFISEMMLLISKKSTYEKSKKNEDKSSLLLFWFTIPLAISLGFFFAKYENWNFWNKSLAIFGLMISFVGIVLRWIAIKQLGKEFTVDANINKDHFLKMDGLYKKVRHPSYLGLLLIILGISLAMNSLASVLLMIFPIFIVVYYRISIEESMLLREFGDKYADYRKNTHKIIPKLF